MTLRLNGSSSGFTEVKAPAAAGSNTITLPTSNGSAEQFLKNSGTAGELEYSSMVETSTGVGIGTSSPATDLAVVDGSVGIELDNSGGFAGAANTATVRAFDRPNTTYKTLGVTGSNVLLGINDVEKMRVDSTGLIGMATTAKLDGNNVTLAVKGPCPATPIEVQQDSTASHFAITFRNSNGLVGSIATNGSSTNYNGTSDYRLKENVVDLTGAITRVKQLAPKRFNFIVDADRTVDGFLAHEAQTVVPEAVTGTHDEVDDDNNPVYQGIDQSKLVPLLTAALQEAISKIETLETKVAALEAA